MTRIPAVLVCLALVSACGGGGTGGPPATQPDVLKIESNDVSPLGANYRAVFDCRARLRVSSNPLLPVNVTGTLTIENEGETIQYPVDTARSGSKVRYTILLNVPSALRQQDPTLPATVTLTLREYIQVDAAGAWLSLGGDAEDPTVDPAAVYQVWWAEPITNLEPTMFPGQVIEVPATNVLSEDLADVLGTRSSVRTVRDQAEVIDTPFGLVECYHSDVVETIASTDPGTDPVEVRFERWERPDLGILRLHVEGYEFTFDNGGSPLTITLESLDCDIDTLDS